MISIDLSGKTALVTGASQGLGASIAQTLSRAGAAVAINYLPDQDNQRRAEQVAAQLGNRAVALPGDVRDPTDVQNLVDRVISDFGALDVVVNNAGVLRDRTVRKMTATEWQEVIDCNLTGVFNVCQAVAEKIAPGGRIVSMSSVSAVVGFYGQANYAAAKAGIIGLTKVMSREMAGRQVTVNAVAPGVVDAGMGLTIPAEHRQTMLDAIPLGRFATADDVAQVVLFLCSDLAAYMTGQTLHVNGGWWAP